METGVFGTWINTTGDSLTTLWGSVLNFLPSLIGAVIVFLIGLIIASLLEKVVERVVSYLKIDNVLRKAEVEAYFERANMKVNVSGFIGKLVYWFIVVAFLLAASEILKFSAFSEFLNNVLEYIPRVIIAVLIMIATLVVANFLRQLVTASLASARLNHAKGLGALTWWVVVIFGFLTALPQVGVDPGLINYLVLGLIIMLSLAGGLAFGLGGRDRAAQFLNHWSEEMKK